MYFIYPWRNLKHAAFLGFVASICVYGVLHSPPHSDLANLMWIMTALFAVPAVVLAWTALRWIWAGMRAVLRGPQ
jgi:hypothetical protein